MIHATYAIDDEDSTQCAAGMRPRDAFRVARTLADRMRCDTSVYRTDDPSAKAHGVAHVTTDANLKALRAEAATAGDLAMVATIDEALQGDADALEFCGGVIRAAQRED